MNSTARRILDYLEQHGPATTVELARHLGRTRQNIQHHLGNLQTEGWVVATGQRPPAGRGRPATVYRLHPARLRHNLDGLCRALLDLLLAGQDEAQAEALLDALAQRLSQQSEPPGGNLTQRLYHAIRRLNDLGYQARWEAHADAPRVVLARCPYLTLAEEEPILCRMDALLIQRLTAMPVMQTARRETDGRVCIFRIG